MSDLFSACRDVSIIAHMEKHGSKIQQAGSTKRANPCPVCNHKDCCTVYPNENSYKCFSCDAAGDVINLERALGGHESNLAAAKALAAQYGINIDAPKPPAEKYQSKKTTNNPKPTRDTPYIPPDKAAEIRRLAADLFHKNLMATPAALGYQIKKRGHTPETLKKHMVGLATPAIMKAGTDAGYTMDELSAVGVVRKRGKGYAPYIGADFYVYPHFIGDRIAHFTIKDPKKEQKYQLRRVNADPDWILYGQDTLENPDKEIWMVEGEDDRITLIERGGVKHTVAIIGNSNTPTILEWLGANAKGKTFYLAFDPDEAGKGYAAKYGTTIFNAGGKAYVIDLSEYNDDIDAVLHGAADPADTIASLKKQSHLVELGTGPNDDDAYTFGSYEVLGEMASGAIAFWSSVRRRTYFFEIKELTLDHLCQVGGWEVRARVSRTQQEGKLQFKSLKTHHICKAGDNYLGNLRVLGQGIHLLRDGRLLIVNGDEAMIWDGDVFTPQHHPIIDQQYISGESDLQWIHSGKLRERVMEMTQETAEQIVDSIMQVVSGWQFSNSLENVLFAGWIMGQVVQSAWEWRPQLWLSGASGSGKTMLTQLVEALGGNLACRFEGNILTEAGLRQTLQNHAYCTIIDEFEQSQHRDRIIERLRSAGRGGKGAIGSSRQEAQISHIRHMVMIASIETGLIRAAEQYRYLQIYTQKDNRIKPTIPAPAELEKLQIDMVAYALWAVYRAKEMIRNTEGFPGHDNRWVHSVLVPFSMIAAFDENPVDTLRDLTGQYLEYWGAAQEGSILEDEAALLQDIMLAAIRIAETIDDGDSGRTVYVERTIGQLLSDPHDLPEDLDKSIQAHGIRIVENDDMFIYPETVAKKLLGRTRWQDLNLRDILLRCEGAQRSRQYIAGTRVRGVLIPAKTWVS